MKDEQQPVARWQWVPVDPTPEMNAAGFAVPEAEHDPSGVFRAMALAAPPRPDEWLNKAMDLAHQYASSFHRFATAEADTDRERALMAEAERFDAALRAHLKEQP